MTLNEKMVNAPNTVLLTRMSRKTHEMIKVIALMNLSEKPKLRLRLIELKIHLI